MMASSNPTARAPLWSELVRQDASFESIVAEFVEGLGDRLAAMEEALQASDFEALRVAAHRLKGSGGGYGYPLLTHYAARLEHHARNAAAEDCAHAVEELKELCARIVVDPDTP